MGGNPASEMRHHVRYSTVTGYFLQDDPDTEPVDFDFTTTNFGLIDRSYDTDLDLQAKHETTQWQRFAHHISIMNEKSDQNTDYKVLFMGRHGEGYHNVAEAFYGTEAWDCYWSLQDGNETLTWVDARLTPVGVAQAEKANRFWARLISDQQIVTPESYYTSPLLRCCATASVTFSGLNLPREKPFVPTVKELFREAIGAHTCDKRSPKGTIMKEYPGFKFEENFEEEDLLFKSNLRETDKAEDQRTKKVLDDVFTNDENTWISISSHSGEISSILRVLEHRKFGLGTGQAIPVLVKAEVVEGPPPQEDEAPWRKITPCEKPPAT